MHDAFGGGLPVIEPAEPPIQRAQRAFLVSDPLLDPIEVARQPGQLGRGGLELALLGPELLGAVDHGLPVDLGEIARLVQPGEYLALFDRGVPRLLLPLLLRRDLAEAAGQHPGPVQQRVELALVGPAEHVPAAVIDAVPVVFLVPPAAAFHLPGLGDRPGHPAELRHRLDAHVVGAPVQLVLQPAGERRVPDQQLGGQRARPALGWRRGGPRRLGHAVVDHPVLQVVGVDPVGHGGIVPVGHQHRKREAVQQPLCGAFPVGLTVPHRDQLASERQRVVFRCAARGTMRRAAPVASSGCWSCAPADCAAPR